MLSEAFQIIQLNQKLSVFTVKNKVHIEAKKKKKRQLRGLCVECGVAMNIDPQFFLRSSNPLILKRIFAYNHQDLKGTLFSSRYFIS